MLWGGGYCRCTAGGCTVCPVQLVGGLPSGMLTWQLCVREEVALLGTLEGEAEMLETGQFRAACHLPRPQCSTADPMPPPPPSAAHAALHCPPPAHAVQPPTPLLQSYTRDTFLFIFLALTAVAAGYSLKQHRSLLLHRTQTEEWKGWMQVGWCGAGGFQRSRWQTSVWTEGARGEPARLLVCLAVPCWPAWIMLFGGPLPPTRAHTHAPTPAGPLPAVPLLQCQGDLQRHPRLHCSIRVDDWLRCVRQGDSSRTGCGDGVRKDSRQSRVGDSQAGGASLDCHR